MGFGGSGGRVVIRVLGASLVGGMWTCCDDETVVVVLFGRGGDESLDLIAETDGFGKIVVSFVTESGTRILLSDLFETRRISFPECSGGSIGTLSVIEDGFDRDGG